jgi:hypothetical protein
MTSVSTVAMTRVAMAMAMTTFWLVDNHRRWRAGGTHWVAAANLVSRVW